jgi:hypothetical protein
MCTTEQSYDSLTICLLSARLTNNALRISRLHTKRIFKIFELANLTLYFTSYQLVTPKRSEKIYLVPGKNQDGDLQGYTEVILACT